MILFLFATKMNVYHKVVNAMICVTILLKLNRDTAKGQIISKCFFLSLISSKKRTKTSCSKVEFFRWFFGGNRRHQKLFRNYLTFIEAKCALVQQDLKILTQVDW